MQEYDYPKKPSSLVVFGSIVSVITVVIGLLFFGLPVWNVWSSDLSGRAALAKSIHDRRIRVEEAKAGLEASKLDAKSEVERAKGVAEANKIVADGLGGPQGYLRWYYINMLRETQDKQIIYIPTEAGLPILEAGKRPSIQK